MPPFSALPAVLSAAPRAACPPMPPRPVVHAVVPAYNEASAIVAVVVALLSLSDVAGRRLLDRVIVADNGSDDGTGALAEAAGALVVVAPRRGYGHACMAGLGAAADADIVLFVDGDRSVQVGEAVLLLASLAAGADLAIGVRRHVAPGAMTLPQVFGNQLACLVSRLLWRVPITDLGPFRAIRHDALRRIGMEDMTYGWTIEMQLKAYQLGLDVREVPVSLQCRLGVSKISGTVRGVVGAAVGIFSMIGKLWWRARKRRAPAASNAVV